MRRFSAPLLALSLVSAARVCGAFVSPTGTSDGAAVAKFVASDATTRSSRLGRRRPASPKGRSAAVVVIATRGKNDPEEERDFVDADERRASPPLERSSSDVEEKREPSLKAKASFNGFLLFSYCIQFFGLFFSAGLVLNLLGFGYTFDMERGLVVDRIQNIRNEVQFEREIEREERAELKGGSAGSKYILAPSVPENNAVSLGEE
mmetsp:Transcript_1328/g.2866  ORF Transcript_1328/g.2866 Transcript_1328/m.2866 type:complete len:206 (-) Transcript_1328:576-1193(-)